MALGKPNDALRAIAIGETIRRTVCKVVVELLFDSIRTGLGVRTLPRMRGSSPRAPPSPSPSPLPVVGFILGRPHPRHCLD